MGKLTIIINGQGGAGKDSICDVVAKHYRTQNISSITPAKRMAKIIGWKATDKSDKARKMLSDLKTIMVEYNEYPTTYALNIQNRFMKSDDEILFIHIREPKEIKKFLEKTKFKTVTLLIKAREALSDKKYGNKSDDEVALFNYDYYYTNNGMLKNLEHDVMSFFNKEIAF